jgi:hypothetical protein
MMITLTAPRNVEEYHGSLPLCVYPASAPVADAVKRGQTLVSAEAHIQYSSSLAGKRYSGQWRVQFRQLFPKQTGPAA